MKVAIVGCGFIADTHAQTLKQLNHTIVVAVDENLQRAESFKSKWGAQRATDNFDEAIADGIDCVHLCTPPALHFNMIKAVFKAKKHIVCAKPLCLSSAQAKELMELAAGNGLLSAVNFNVRYHEACQRAKDIISLPDFGQIRLIHGSYLQEFHILPAAYMWRYIPDLAGKMRAVTEIGSHWIDLVRFWTHLEIEQVSANFGRFNPNRILKDGMMYPAEDGGKTICVDSEDAAIVSLRFSNGAIGSLLLSEVSHGRSNSINIEVTSSKRSVWWCSEDPYRLNTAEHYKGVTSMVNAFGGGFPDNFFSFFQKFYATLENGLYQERNEFPTFYDGWVNVAVCEAIYESARNNSVWTEVK